MSPSTPPVDLKARILELKRYDANPEGLADGYPLMVADADGEYVFWSDIRECIDDPRSTPVGEEPPANDITACGLTRAELHQAVAALDREATQDRCAHVRKGAVPGGVLCRDCRRIWPGDEGDRVWAAMTAADRDERVGEEPPADQELLHAARGALAFLETVEWNDHTSESDAEDVKMSLESAIERAASPRVGSESSQTCRCGNPMSGKAGLCAECITERKERLSEPSQTKTETT